jgi:hypothetical protein
LGQRIPAEFRTYDAGRLGKTKYGGARNRGLNNFSFLPINGVLLLFSLIETAWLILHWMEHFPLAADLAAKSVYMWQRRTALFMTLVEPPVEGFISHWGQVSIKWLSTIRISDVSPQCIGRPQIPLHQVKLGGLELQEVFFRGRQETSAHKGLTPR